MKRKGSGASTGIGRRLLFIFLCLFGAIALVLLLVFFLPRPYHKTGFTDLASINAYAKKINEMTPFVGDNTIKPDFTPFYKSQEPTWRSSYMEKLKWLGSFIKLSNPPAWSPSFFKTMLEDLAKTRQEKNWKGDFVCKITPGAQTKIVVFGNIQGAFHSLVRDLNKLKDLGIIDNNLKVANQDNFIVFLGDIVSRSAFSIQTLSLLMRLVQVNPNNVVYLRGNHESNNYWQEHTLKTELQTYAAYLDKNTIPLMDPVNAFFNTLPLAGYIVMHNEDADEFIRISDAGRTQNKLLNEVGYGKFLFAKATGTSFQAITEGMKESADKEPTIRVIFKGEKKRETYQPTQGIRLLPSDMGSVAWNVLSCPTAVYQKALKFFHDAFAVITPAPKVDNWTLTLYNRDVRTQDTFKETVFNLLSGTEQATGKAAPTAEPTEKEKDAADKHAKDKGSKKDDKKEKSKDDKKEDTKDKVKDDKKESKEDKQKEEKPKDEKKDTPKEEKKPEKEKPQEEKKEKIKDEKSEKSKEEKPKEDKKKESAPTLDMVTTSTVAAHVKAIGKNARELAEHAEAIAAAISTITIPDGTTKKDGAKTNESKEKDSKKEKPKAEPEDDSAFEPVEEETEEE